MQNLNSEDPIQEIFLDQSIRLPTGNMSKIIQIRNLFALKYLDMTVVGIDYSCVSEVWNTT